MRKGAIEYQFDGVKIRSEEDILKFERISIYQIPTPQKKQVFDSNTSKIISYGPGEGELQNTPCEETPLASGEGCSRATRTASEPAGVSDTSESDAGVKLEELNSKALWPFPEDICHSGGAPLRDGQSETGEAGITAVAKAYDVGIPRYIADTGSGINLIPREVVRSKNILKQLDAIHRSGQRSNFARLSAKSEVSRFG